MTPEEIRERYLFHDRSFKASGIEPDQEHHDIGTLLQLLAEARKAQEWRDIETAPRESGKIIMLGSPDTMSETGWRSRNEPDLFENEYGFIRPQPTHWQPLPKPPEGV